MLQNLSSKDGNFKSFDKMILLNSQAAVFENAEEAIQDYLAFVEEQRKAGFPQEKPQTKRSRDDLQW